MFAPLPLAVVCPVALDASGFDCLVERDMPAPPIFITTLAGLDIVKAPVRLARCGDREEVRITGREGSLCRVPRVRRDGFRFIEEIENVIGVRAFDEFTVVRGDRERFPGAQLQAERE